MCDNTKMKLFLATLPVSGAPSQRVFTQSNSMSVFVLAPNSVVARERAEVDISDDDFYGDDERDVSIVYLPDFPPVALNDLEYNGLLITYVPPAPVARPTMFVGTFRRDAGPFAIQFVELLKKEIVKGLFNNVDPTDGAALMRAAASKMLSSWGLLVGAMDSELRKGGMPEGTVESLKEDLRKVPFGTNTHIWELVYVPDAGIGYYTLGAYRRG